MSRSEYSEDCDSNWLMIQWRGAVASAIRGQRGQTFLYEMLHALAVWNEQYATCGSSCNFAPSPNWRDVMNTGV